MTTNRHCPRCGRELTAGSLEGLCPSCVAQELLLGEAETRSQKPEVGDQKSKVTDHDATGKGEPVVSEGPGSVIGHYKLLQLIGEGGFGEVYLAEQKEPVKRRVALKIIKLGMDTKEVVARFEAERQALALMDHPNIAKVLDGGATASGRPYFVMELVRGVPITQYCDMNDLLPDKRLELFTQVCHAIQHAHQKGIIHRDIKPSNILVTLHDGEPVPKVIDFGLAKATQLELTQKTVFTRFHQFLGTPAYMSPEQAELSGLDIDTRSDVYSLGVLLYELLAGKTPFDVEDLVKAGLDEMRRRIREEEPVRPSMRLSTMAEAERTRVAKHRQSEAPKLIRLLRGDLDWIVMKCLEKDRNRRYETANGLAADLQRHLDNDAVLARPPSTAYRFQKLLRRHKLAFGAAAGVSVALGLCTITSLCLWRRAQSGERRVGQLLYATQMSLAQQAWEQNDMTRFRDLLEESRGHWDRGFEWYYWQRQVHSDVRTLRRHSKAVMGVAFSPDGLRVVTGSRDRTAKIWEFSSGRELLTLTGHTAPVWAVAFSPDGQRIATASGDGTARVWNASTGEVLATLLGATMDSVAFSPDGRCVVTGSADHTARMWDASSGRELCTLNGHSAPIRSVAFSPDGQRILTGGLDGTFRMWGASNCQELLTIAAHTTKVWSVACSPDGRLIVSGGDDGMARVWAASDGQELCTLRGHRGLINSVAFSPDGRRVVTGSWDQTARVWETSNGRELLTMKGHTGEVWSVAVSPDSQHVLTASEDGTEKVWEMNRNWERLDVKGHTGAVLQVAFSPDGQRFVTASDDQTAKVWETLSGRHLATLRGHTSAVTSVAFSPEGYRLVTGSWDQTKLWDVFTGQELLAFKTDPIRGVAFSSDGLRVVTGTMHGVIEVWQASSGRELQSIDLGEVLVALAADGERALTENAQHLGRVWDLHTVHTGREPLELKQTAADPTEMVFVEGGERVAALLEREIWSAAFSLDGRRLLTGSSTQAARVWDTTNGRELFALKGHTGATPAVAFSRDGRRLLTQGDDRILRVWDAANGQQLLTLKGKTFGRLNLLACVAFSPDGRQIVAGNPDGSVSIWQTASAAQVASWLQEEQPAAK